MAITPTGSPVWVRTTSFSDYGGHANKRDFMGVGAINAETDLSAAEFSRMVTDAAATARTAPFAVIRFLNNDATTSAPTIQAAYLMTGVRTTSYEGGAAPTGFPSASRSSNGVVVFTFASSYTDDYGISGAFAPYHAEASLCDSGDPGNAAAIISGQTVTVRCYDWSGATSPDRLVTLVVY